MWKLNYSSLMLNIGIELYSCSTLMSKHEYGCVGRVEYTKNSSIKYLALSHHV